jgi:hypothetical protein
MNLAQMYAPHQIKAPIDWKQEERILSNVTLKSYKRLTNQELIWIRNSVVNTEEGFKTYNHLRSCSNEPFELRIISHSQMNSSTYFYDIEPGYITYGRYYKLNNVMYLTPETFDEPEFIKHEVAHYMYDDCNVGLEPDVEHVKLEGFIKWLH